MLKACSEGEDAVNSALSTGDYQGALAALAGLREPIDRSLTKCLLWMKMRTCEIIVCVSLTDLLVSFGGVADMGALAGRR